MQQEELNTIKNVTNNLSENLQDKTKTKNRKWYIIPLCIIGFIALLLYLNGMGVHDTNMWYK